MRLVDAHCHLESEEFEGILETILDEAQQAGVVRFISAAVCPEEWQRSESIGKQFKSVEFALGVHPWYAKENDLERVAALGSAKQRGAKAIGEIGLDKKVQSPPMDLQRPLFERQLEIAKAIDLPVVVHCRGAFDELVRSLRRIGAPAAGGVVHAFSGSVEIVEELLGFGFCFSFGNSLTYRNSSKRERVLKRVYPDFLLLETDSPDMPPVEVPERPNKPANIRYNLRAAAEILGVPEEEIAEATTQNAARLFGLGL